MSFGSCSLSIADSGRVVRAVLRAAYRRRRALLDLEGCCALANYFVSRVASCHVSTAYSFFVLDVVGKTKGHGHPWRVLLGLQQLLQKGGGGLEEAHASIMISWRRMLRPWEFLPTDFFFGPLNEANAKSRVLESCLGESFLAIARTRDFVKRVCNDKFPPTDRLVW